VRAWMRRRWLYMGAHEPFGSLTTANVLDTLDTDPRLVRFSAQELLDADLSELYAMYRLVYSLGAARELR
jgi:hypothetical protein